MKKNVRLFILIIVSLMTIGFSTFFVANMGMMNSVSNKSDEIIVSVYNTNYTQPNTEVKYYIPDPNSIVVNESAFLSPTDSDGKTTFEEKWGEVGSWYNTVEYDKKPGFYNIDSNGKYTKIDTHNSSKGPEQIKNKHIEVNKRNEVSSDSEWGNVWDVGYGSNKFYFYTNCEDNKQYNNKYKKGDIIDNSEKVIFSKKSEIDPITNTRVTTEIRERVIVRDILNQVRGKFLGGIRTYLYGYFYPTYQYRKVEIIETLPRTETSSLLKTIHVKKGTNLNPFKLNVEGSEFVNYYSDAACTQLFDFKKQLTENTDIYLKQIQVSPNTMTLGKKISEMNSSSSINHLAIYNSNHGGSGKGENVYDIFQDPTYEPNNGFISINNEIIEAGKEISLTYNDSKIYEGVLEGQIKEGLAAHRTSDDSNLSPFYENNTFIGYKKCSTRVFLQNDLTVKGTINIGGKIGGFGTTNVSKYGYIIGSYACLDLNGYNLIIDGGKLNNFGMIVDSVGTGSIIVKNNSTILGSLSVSDGRSIRGAVVGVMKRQSPFTDYRFLGFNTKIIIYNGCKFNAYLKMDLGEFNIANYIIPFLSTGNDNTNPLFIWDDQNNESYVLMTNDLNDDFSVSFKRECFNIRNKFTFNASIKQNPFFQIKITVEISSLAAPTAVIDFAKIDFPISPFIDVVIKKNNTFTINSIMTFYPGSSLYAEKGSLIKFGHLGEKKYDAVGALGINVISEETRYLAGGIVSYDNNISSLSQSGHANEKFSSSVYGLPEFWKFIKYGGITIQGNVSFDSSINTTHKTNEGFYTISGNIDCSSEAMKSIILNKQYLKTYFVKGELGNGYLFAGAEMSPDNQFIRAFSYNCLPLISNNMGYCIDANLSLVGEYYNSALLNTKIIDLKDGKLEYNDNNSKSYFLEVTTFMNEGGSSGNNQKNKVDRNVFISEIEYLDKEHNILKKVQGDYFAYYKGIYVPVITMYDTNLPFDINAKIVVNGGKFMSNSQTSQDQRTITEYKKYLSNYAFNKTLSNTTLDIKDVNGIINLTALTKFSDGGSNTININNNGTCTVDFKMKSIGNFTINVDNDLNITYINNLQGTNVTVDDQLATASKQLILTSKIVDSSNKEIYTVKLSIKRNGNVISLTLTYSKENKTIDELTISAGNNNLSTRIKDGSTSAWVNAVYNTSNCVISQPISANFSDAYNKTTLKWNNSTKSWTYFDYAKYTKDQTQDTYYTY